MDDNFEKSSGFWHAVPLESKLGLIGIIKENKKQLLNLNNDIDNSVFSKDDLKSILTQEKLLLEQTTKQVTCDGHFINVRR